MAPEDYMRIAINEALKGEGWTNPNPMVGAVIVKDGRILSKDYHHKCGEYHAERNAILNCGEDMRGAEIYVTLEPCPMCMGAMLNARVKKVYFGAYEAKGRSMTEQIAESNLLNHRIEVEGGVMQEECSRTLSTFFSQMRERLKQ